ncbi:hypothetical protein GCE86_26060 [Micromonospora terminaliae]|uniref:Integrase n=1 Tax=Micromonospora terminaliae TaxID=1914461 RepID=A0ABX6EB57_9ACTN|nr:hypothetical protein GCE86_26060 [Micromonospora terminaliae]
MAINKRGSRPIVVDGKGYRWLIRRKPTYSQGLTWSPLSFAVDRTDAPGCATLIVRSASPRPDNWMNAAASPVLPSAVASAIRQALERGWQPGHPGSPFVLTLG